MIEVINQGRYWDKKITTEYIWDKNMTTEYIQEDAKDITSLRLNTPACFGCGVCMLACPRGVFTVRNGKAVITDPSACTECGVCMLACPVNAISVITQSRAEAVRVGC